MARLTLSRHEQRQAQTTILRVGIMNPLGATLTIGPFSFLLALFYGADDFTTGLLYASHYIAGLAAIFTIRLLNGPAKEHQQAAG